MFDNVVSIMEYRLLKEQKKHVITDDYDCILLDRFVKSLRIYDQDEKKTDE